MAGILFAAFHNLSLPGRKDGVTMKMPDWLPRNLEWKIQPEQLPMPCGAQVARRTSGWLEIPANGSTEMCLCPRPGS
jgi:hypothetical protein